MEKLALSLPGGKRIDPVAGMPSGGDETLQEIIRWGVATFFVLIVITALFFLIWGGIQWITSGGDKAKIETARKRILYAIIGIIVAFSSYLIINTLGYFLGVQILNVSR